MKTTKKLLSVLLLCCIIVGCMLTGFAFADNSTDTPTYVAFTSDVHNSKGNNDSATRLTNWISNVQTTIGAPFDTMAFCGDYASASSRYTADQYWVAANTVFNNARSAKENGKINNLIFAAGNHEYNPGNGTNNSNFNSNITTNGLYTYKDYYIICFGAKSQNQSLSSTELKGYLNGVSGTDKPIFIVSHYPLHNYTTSRTINGKDDVIKVIYEDKNASNIYFIWGHNHTESDTHYDNCYTGSLDGTTINFTYCAAGCMSDSEYSDGSASVDGKGLVAKIIGSNVTLTYYDANGKSTYTYPEVIPEPYEALIIANNVTTNNTYALSSANSDTTYTNGENSNYYYSGLTGVSYEEGVTEITDDLIWKIIPQSGNKIQIKYGDKYLCSSYSANNKSGYDGSLYLSETAETWSFNGNKLVGSGSGKQLAHGNFDSDKDTTITNLFTVRSAKNSSNITIISYTRPTSEVPASSKVVDSSSTSSNAKTASISEDLALHVGQTATLQTASTSCTASNDNISIATIENGISITGDKVGNSTVSIDSSNSSSYKAYIKIGDYYLTTSIGKTYYTNSNAYTYNGLEGTTEKNSASIWTITKIDDKTITIQSNETKSRYLYATYEKSSDKNNGYVGTVGLTETFNKYCDWEINENGLLNPDLQQGSDTTKKYYLNSYKSDGNPGTITVRSSGNAYSAEHISQTINVTVSDHSFNTPVYTWNDDKSECTVLRSCDCGYSESVTVSSYSTTVDATCSEEGSITYTADFSVSELAKEFAQVQTAEPIVIPTTAHTYGEYTTTKAPTCNVAGEKTATCSVCQQPDTKTIDALGHDFASDFTVDVRATCTTDGSQSHHCSRCSETSGSETISATGHSYGEYTTTKAPTCNVAGEKTATCSVCQATDTKAIDALGHNFASDFTVDTEATCTTVGSKSHHCSRCSETSDSETIPVTDHDFKDGVCTVCQVADPNYKPAGDGSGASGGSSGGAAPTGGSSSTPNSEPEDDVPDEDVPLANIPSFKDVNESDWYYDDVVYMYMNNLMNGITEDTFEPTLTTTRGMIVTILYRIEGSPEVTGECPFADVDAGSYYEKAITWAAANKIVLGYTSDTYAPDQDITREQMAAILYRYAAFKGIDVSELADISAFTDAVDISSYAVDAIRWANACKLVTGTSETTLDPTGNAQRCQVAAMFHRFAEMMKAEVSE